MFFKYENRAFPQLNSDVMVKISVNEASEIHNHSFCMLLCYTFHLVLFGSAESTFNSNHTLYHFKRLQWMCAIEDGCIEWYYEQGKKFGGFNFLQSHSKLYFVFNTHSPSPLNVLSIMHRNTHTETIVVNNNIRPLDRQTNSLIKLYKYIYFEFFL